MLFDKDSIIGDISIDKLDHLIESLEKDVSKLEKELEILYEDSHNKSSNRNERFNYTNDLDQLSKSIIYQFEKESLSSLNNNNNTTTVTLSSSSTSINDSATDLIDDNQEEILRSETNDSSNNNNNIESSKNNVKYNSNINQDSTIILDNVIHINTSFHNKVNDISLEFKSIKKHKQQHQQNNENKCLNCLISSQLHHRDQPQQQQHPYHLQYQQQHQQQLTNNLSSNSTSTSSSTLLSPSTSNSNFNASNQISTISTIKEFSEWRSLIDDEVIELYSLIKELKTKLPPIPSPPSSPQIPNRDDSINDAPASPILSGKTRHKELYMHNNTFTNLLQLKNDLVGILKNPFFKNNNNNENDNKNSNITTAINNSTIISNTYITITPDNNNNSNNNKINNLSNIINDNIVTSAIVTNNNNNNNITTIPEEDTNQSKSAPNSPAKSRRERPPSPTLSPARGRANSAERSLVHTKSTNNLLQNNNINSNNNNINNSNIKSSHLNSTPQSSPAKSNKFVIRAIQPNSPVFSPSKTNNYYYKLSELDQEKCEEEIKAWIQKLLNSDLSETSPHLPNSSPLSHHLRSGVILCQVINSIRPNTIKKINLTPTPFLQMENIAHFLQACENLGVDKKDLFHSLDLYEMKNMKSVVATIYSLARSTHKIDDLRNSIFTNNTNPLNQSS
ncbi:hypothetical protein CYY_006550 [Polysphondylium violaceum]|uniref:Calponin-homology (CH) domain-containing protein n=1 Tax=Polysphondylium violaceum TaxID=133409 RepID=A0A8J4PZJ8_9MYCE|nr:hypothetical protein CYY_006550 [Polysphondylium violaceum]